MTSDDDLRVRLAGLDPASHLHPVESPRAPELLERIMSTPVLSPPESSSPGRRRGLVVGWAAAAAALAIGAGALGIALNDDAKPGKAPTTLALKLPGGGPVMSSCIRFDVELLKDMSPAFAGTVTSVDAGKVVLDVDHWYAGGSADQVELAVPDQQTSAELDGVAFEKGQRYLVTAAEGNVNGCGYTGLATPQLQSAFDEAFGG
jgi:hypothetical protein